MNMPASHPVVSIAPFPFRLEPGHVLAYRQALSEQGTRIPFAMALRALARDEVVTAVRRIANGRHCIHLAQEIEAQGELRTGVDYLCDVCIFAVGEDRLRIEQCLRIGEQEPFMILSSTISLVAQ